MTSLPMADDVLIAPLTGRSTGPMPTSPVPEMVADVDPPTAVAVICNDWPVVGPHALYTARSYAEWSLERDGGTTLFSEALRNLDDARRHAALATLLMAMTVLGLLAYTALTL